MEALMKKENLRKAYDAVEIATEFIKFFEREKVDPNIAQASMGNGWYRICRGMGIDPDTFEEMALGMSTEYRKEHKKEKNG